jgi:hypothetical protein
LEAFAWLPPGSFPMSASEVFSFAMQHVQLATEADVMSSLLPSLVNNEDKVLDAKSRVSGTALWSSWWRA